MTTKADKNAADRVLTKAVKKALGLILDGADLAEAEHALYVAAQACDPVLLGEPMHSGRVWESAA